MSEVHTPPYVVNIGPQHPSTHGVFRVKATLDGERIIDAEMVLGYLHRSIEKLAEERTFTQNIPFTDRMDYLAAMTGNLSYCLAAEKLAGIEVPERGSRSEEHTSELQSRLHLVCRLLLEKKKKNSCEKHDLDKKIEKNQPRD